MKRISLPNYINRYGARFELTEHFLDKENTTIIDTTEDNLESVGVPLTHVDTNIFATSKDEFHCFVIGDSGCGKTRRVILPTIRLLSKTGESMVISDPKGELYRTTANLLSKKGYSVRVLNFRNPSKGNRWNPLALIDSLYHTDDRDSKDKAIMMLNDIIDVLQQKQNGEKSDPFWTIAAANVLRGTALLILEFGEPGQLTFENISLTAREIREQIVKNEEDKKKNGSPFDNSTESKPTTFESFLNSLPKGSPILNNLSVIITNAESTRNCIMGEFETMVSLYACQESLIDLFSVSEIDISELGVKPTALFFILPDDTEVLYPIATVFVKQIYSTLVNLADEQKNGKLPNRVTFLLDEFANFTKMPSIESMLTAARSRGIRFVLVCQSMDQLTAKYEEHGRETIMSNCRSWIYMSCRNHPFLKRLEELCGFYNVPYSNEKVPLISVDELQHLEKGGFDKDCQVLILNDRCRPIMGYLPDYSKYDFGEDETETLSVFPLSKKQTERKIFGINDAFAKAKSRNAPVIEEKKQEEKREFYSLRSSILEIVGKFQQPTSDDDENDKVGEVEEDSDDTLPVDRLLHDSDDDTQIVEPEADTDAGEEKPDDSVDKNAETEPEESIQSEPEQPEETLPEKPFDIDSLLMDDEEEDEPSESSSGSDSIADIKAQLQKLIKEKLSANHDDDDDDD